MKNIITLILSVLKKSILNQTGYKFFIFYIIFGSFVEIIIYYMTNKFVDGSVFTLSTSGLDYFSFILVGYVFTDIFTTCIMSGTSVISRERSQGTFETLLLSPHSTFFLLIINSIPEILKSFLRSFIFIFIGTFLGLSIKLSITTLSTIPFLILSILIFLSFSMVFSGLLLISWRFIHFTSIFVSLSTVFSGAFYPLALLPENIKNLIYYLPFAYTTEKFRALLMGKIGLLHLFTSLLLFTLCTLLFSYLVFNIMKKHSQKTGTILKY